MSYISTEKVKEKRNLLKKSFPDFKFSVRCEDLRKIEIKILSGPIEMIHSDITDCTGDGYIQVNPYYIDDHFSDLPDARDFLKKVWDIARSGVSEEVYCSDYGSIPSFYVDIDVGTWDKPYINTKAGEKITDIMDNFNITIDEFVTMYGYTAVDSHVVSDYYFYMETLKTFCMDFEDEGGAMTSNDIANAKTEAFKRVQSDTSHYVPTNPLQRKLQLIKEVV